MGGGRDKGTVSIFLEEGMTPLSEEPEKQRQQAFQATVPLI